MEGLGRRWRDGGRREEGKAAERGHGAMGEAERDSPRWGRRCDRGGTERAEAQAQAVGQTEAEQTGRRVRQVNEAEPESESAAHAAGPKAEVGQSPEEEAREGETEVTRKAERKQTKQRSRGTLPGDDGGRPLPAARARSVLCP